MEEAEGFDFYDLLFFLYASYKNEEFFSFYKDEEKRVTDWLFLLVYAFVYLDILLRSYPNAYKYSNLYEIFQINLYKLESIIAFVSGKGKQDQKFLEFFSNIRN